VKHLGHHSRPDSLERLGLTGARRVYWNLTTAELYTEVIKRDEGLLAHLGPLVVATGHYTGRSPRDKFIVNDAASTGQVNWGNINQPMLPERFALLKAALLDTAKGKDLFVQDLFVGAHPDYRVPIRVVTQFAWHALFARNLFIRPTLKSRKDYPEPLHTVIALPSFRADPKTMGTRSETVIAMNLSENLVLIGATEYAGEIKKAVFSLMNYELPFKGVLPMHCSANAGPENDVALFFGLSGTGKTTLSATAGRTLIGDDEHGWSEAGIFNIEGGCYAKIEHLSAQAEPEIYQTTRRFGTILENVVLDPETRRVDLNDTSKTQNTRAAYPISHISSASLTGFAGQPSDIIFLTADAFGVLPPIARLSLEQALYYFLSGYTAKVMGAERGGTEPQAAFSTCFGAPFMPLRPSVYADLLGRNLRRHDTSTWLVNTGWTGGPYGIGERMPIAYTRAMIRAALEGRLDNIPYRHHSLFGLAIPESCPDVPNTILDPQRTWSDQEAYRYQATRLAAMFIKNFRQFESDVPAAVKAAGPDLAIDL